MASQAEKQFSIGKPVRIPKALREELEAAIQAHLTAVEKLTAVLDKADGEADLEPSLGISGRAVIYCNNDDCPASPQVTGATIEAAAKLWNHRFHPGFVAPEVRQ